MFWNLCLQYNLFRQNISSVMNNIITNLGNLLGGNFKQLVELLVSDLQLELDNSKEANANIEQEFELFKKTVDQKIKDQKVAFADLKNLSGIVEVASKDMESALTAHQTAELTTAVISGITSLAASIGGMFLGLPPNPSTFQVLAGIAEITNVIIEVAKMMAEVAQMFGMNTNIDRSALHNLEFEITRDYEKGLQQASYFKSKLPQFTKLRTLAYTQLNRIEVMTKNKVSAVTYMKQKLFEASDSGVFFVNEVNN